MTDEQRKSVALEYLRTTRATRPGIRGSRAATDPQLLSDGWR
jgi:hypothetical protein